MVVPNTNKRTLVGTQTTQPARGLYASSRAAVGAAASPRRAYRNNGVLIGSVRRGVTLAQTTVVTADDAISHRKRGPPPPPPPPRRRRRIGSVYLKASSLGGHNARRRRRRQRRVRTAYSTRPQVFLRKASLPRPLDRVAARQIYFHNLAAALTRKRNTHSDRCRRNSIPDSTRCVHCRNGSKIGTYAVRKLPRTQHSYLIRTENTIR